MHTYFVIAGQGRPVPINGVPAGDYDLALRLYEPPGDGCLVSPVGTKVVRFQVSEEAAQGARLDLGDIAVQVALGPRVGDMAPDFSVRSFSGETVSLSGLRGRYVLLDFWATWCAPASPASRPWASSTTPSGPTSAWRSSASTSTTTRPRPAGSSPTASCPGFTPPSATGPTSRTSSSRATPISSVPAYILIGPDGKLVHRGSDLEEVDKILKRSLR